MKAPLLLHVGAWSPAVVVVAALSTPARLPPPRRWLAAWAAVSLAIEVAALLMAREGRNNLVIGYLDGAVITTLVMACLGGWQRDRLRAAYLIAIPILLLVGLGIVLLAERTDRFSVLASPVQHLTTAAASAGVLIAGARAAGPAPLTQADWFWGGSGFLLRSAALASLSPLAAHFMTTDPAQAIRAYEFVAAIEAIAALALAKAILCPIRPSGLSS